MTLNQNPIVLTLDAGGTNFVFSAIQNNKRIVSNIVKPSYADNLDKCLQSMVAGFDAILKKLNDKPVAISFAFPGPADYPNGIIGNLSNLPAFKGGVALGPFLKEKFKLPVFINNDGDLFTYGEAIAGFLPHVNNLLKEHGIAKRYANLLGLTFGTGFGAGIVRNKEIFLGDNSRSGEIWLLRNKLKPDSNIEEFVSIRGLKYLYAKEAGLKLNETPEPEEIYKIGKGSSIGNRYAALKAFELFAEAAGDAIANAITLIDGLVVIGGGLSGASELFLQLIVGEMNNKFNNMNDTKIPRLSAKVYNLEDENGLESFLNHKTIQLQVYDSTQKVNYTPEAKIGIGISKLGTSEAVSVGAYNFAMAQLKNL